MSIRGGVYNFLGLFGSSGASLVAFWSGISDLVGMLSGLAAVTLTLTLAFIRYEQGRALRIKNQIAIYELRRKQTTGNEEP